MILPVIRCVALVISTRLVVAVSVVIAIGRVMNGDTMSEFD